MVRDETRLYGRRGTGDRWKRNRTYFKFPDSSLKHFTLVMKESASLVGDRWLLCEAQRQRRLQAGIYASEKMINRCLKNRAAAPVATYTPVVAFHFSDMILLCVATPFTDFSSTSENR